MMGFTQELIEGVPVLRKPAHFLFKTGLCVKNAVAHPLIKYCGYFPRSLSDRGQDAWVIEIFNGKRGGYFLELGAADGFSESNTFLLEKKFGWSGLCIEPNPAQFQLITERYRRTCSVAPELIDETEGDVEFVLYGQESGLVATEAANNDAPSREKPLTCSEHVLKVAFYAWKPTHSLQS